MKARTLNSTLQSVSLVCVLLVSLFSSCVDDSSTGPSHVDNNDYSASEPFSFKIPVASRSGLALDAINGDIEIRGISDADSVRIWGERRVESESVVDATEHLQELSVEITEGTDEVKVKTVQPNETHSRNYVVDYHLELPKSWQISVDHINGNIDISFMEGDLDVNLINGNIIIENIDGNIDADLTNGNMRFWDIKGNVGGNLMNGNIDGKIYLPSSGSCDLDITNGEIDLSIPQSTSATFSAEVTNGTITITDLSLQDETVTQTSITGRLGSGDGQIDLLTTNGNIVVDGF